MTRRMSRKTWLILAVVVIAVGAVVGVALSHGSPGPSDSTSEPQKAPDFTLPTITGANITLSDMEGTPVLLNFWSTSCAYCVQQLPYLENVALQSDGEIEVVVVNMVDSASRINTFFGDYEPTMIVALDEDRATYLNYCQNFDNSRGSIPFTLLVDSEGIVQYKRIGAFASVTQVWDTLSSVFGITAPHTS